MAAEMDGNYLAMAQQAEKAAKVAQSDAAKRSWLAIAESYRELAAEKMKLRSRSTNDTSSV